MNGRAAQKLLERMRNTSSGWRQKDFEHLLLGFGFEYKEGKKHRLYRHPQFTELSISVPRHDTLKEWVAREAVKLIHDLIDQTKEKEDDNGTDSEESRIL